MKLHFSGRSLLLIVTIVFTTFPVFLFGIIEGIEEFNNAHSKAVEMNKQSALLIQHNIRSGIEQFTALFEGISAEIELKSLRPYDPVRFNRVLASYPKVRSIVILDSRGVSVAAYSTSLDVPIGVDYSDRSHVIEARASKRTAVSGLLQGRAVAGSTIIFAVPLLDENNEVAGFLSGSIPPMEIAGHDTLGSDEYAVVIDSGGSVVYSDPGKTRLSSQQLEVMAKNLASAGDGTHQFKMKGMNVDIQALSIQPIGWKIFVGVSPESLTARSREAIRRTAVLALVCALIGVAIISVVSLAAGRGITNVGEQLKRMSAIDLRPIQLSESRFLPAELRSLVANFNRLLERTAKATLSELEAISRVADTILMTTADGTITYVNEAGIRTFGNVTGRNLKDFLDRRVVDSVFAEGAFHEFKGDVVIHKPGGAQFDGFLSSTPVLDDGQVTSMVVIVQDITEEKAARESLVQSDKMITLGELVAGTSHELNNPLAIVTGYSDLLLEDFTLSDEHRMKIESIRKNALRASSVVHSLLAFARKRKPEREKTDVNGVVEAAAQLKDYDLKTSGVRFEQFLAPDLPSVFADPNQLQQVLINLINNAQDAVLLQSTDPKIVLRTEVRGETVLISVEDNGAGITKKDLKKVFDPFFTTKAVGKGTGLGLSISYGIIREHNGDISIQSEPGEGTRVLIELPVDRTEGTPYKKVPKSALNVRSIRILVVDDEVEIVSILRAGLTQPGITVDSACTISDALSLSAAIIYDFVITDVKMPGGSGIDLYKQLCIVNPRYRKCTIFLTGDTSNPGTLQFLEEEGLAYFSKPFKFQDMDRYLKEKASTPESL